MHIVLSQKKEKCAMISSCLIAIQGVSVYTEDKIGNHIPFLLCHVCIDEDAAKGILPPCCLIVSWPNESRTRERRISMSRTNTREFRQLYDMQKPQVCDVDRRGTKAMDRWCMYIERMTDYYTVCLLHALWLMIFEGVFLSFVHIRSGSVSLLQAPQHSYIRLAYYP